jgi:uncharacterized protein (DUF2267 family)
VGDIQPNRPTSTSMEYERFLSIVERDADLGREAARQATHATLETLAERISRGEARDLAEQLPPELAPSVATQQDAEAFGVHEFISRVAAREQVDLATAERHARAVLAALGQAVPENELADLLSELPREFAPLLPRGPHVHAVEADKLVRRVAERALLDETDAWEVTEAVLETLAERIAGGEVDDLLVHLPVHFHPALKRGSAASGGKATRMSADEFVERVAEREGAGVEDAREHVRAVLTTLRETVPPDEFADVMAQLPRDYDELLARALSR